MDNSSCNTKNLLLELESLKSKECVYKMKENNFIRDKEILEDSIKKFQIDLQEKSELIRSLRRDLTTQSSNLYKDLEIKNNELEKVILENEDLKKKNIISQETIDHHVQRIESLKLEMDKRQKFFEREIDCKSKLAGFYESSCQQKEAKILSTSEENQRLHHEIDQLRRQLADRTASMDEMAKSQEEYQRCWAADKLELDQQVLRMKSEISQLQQNGISALHLDKMNPIAAATLKVLKSSRGLMEIYSELHAKISEVDQLQLDKERLAKSLSTSEFELRLARADMDRMNVELHELRDTSDQLKSRLLSLVSELRVAESKRSGAERQLLVARKSVDASDREVIRLNEQLRTLLVVVEGNGGIKQEEVDADSGLYVSVQQLQEANQALRTDNERLRVQLELSDSEQCRQRCDELEMTSQQLAQELSQLGRENATGRSQLQLHEKQVRLLRFLLELKAPGTALTIEMGLRRLERIGNAAEGSSDEANRYEPEMEPIYDPMQNHQLGAKLELCDQQQIFQQQQSLDSTVMDELLDNKRASDEVFVASIEQMRSQLVDFSRKCNDLENKLENCSEKLEEEKELSEKYHQECLLLRSLNKNLSSNSSNLESHIDDLKLKLAGKINLLAERKADIDSYQNVIDMMKSEQVRLRIERDELLKTVDIQEQIMANIKSLQSGAGLADQFHKTQTENRIASLEKLAEENAIAITERDEEIASLSDELKKSRELEAVPKEFEQCDNGCQVDLGPQETVPMVDNDIPVVASDNTALLESQETVGHLQRQLSEEKTIAEEQMAELQMTVDKYEIDIKDLSQKCEFFETQIGLQEKARQEMLSENIKLTEEAHNLNASLKLKLSHCLEELASLKIRLEESENVERTVQIVIDKYAKESNEAKAKYKRELTLHAADSKLLETANREIARLQSCDKSVDEECVRLRTELIVSTDRWKQQVAAMQAHYDELDEKMRECDERNERLYEQLRLLNVENCDSSSYQDIIEDLRNEINIVKASSSLSTVQTERYESEIARLREELDDMREQSAITIDRLNKSQSSDDNASSVTALDVAVIRESNHILRQQKEHLERSLTIQAKEMEEMADQMDKLSSSVTELTEEKDELVKHQTDLEEERTRWKDRCTKLVERAEQMDPEQYKNACNDRDKLRKQVRELEIRLQDTKASLEIANLSGADVRDKLDQERDKLRAELDTVRQLELCVAQTTQNLESARTDHDQVTVQLEEEREKLRREEGIVAQLREIGRKYKSESGKKRLFIVELEKQITSLNEKLGVGALEQQQLVGKLELTESQLVEKTVLYGELQSRCECLERINRDYATKLRAQADKWKAHDDEKSLKRANPGDDDGPEVKRNRADDAEVGESSDEKSDESMDEDDVPTEKESQEVGEYQQQPLPGDGDVVEKEKGQVEVDNSGNEEDLDSDEAGDEEEDGEVTGDHTNEDDEPDNSDKPAEQDDNAHNFHSFNTSADVDDGDTDTDRNDVHTDNAADDGDEEGDGEELVHREPEAAVNYLHFAVGISDEAIHRAPMIYADNKPEAVDPGDGYEADDTGADDDEEELEGEKSENEDDGGDNGSVILIDESDTEGKDSTNYEDNEEEYNSLVSAIEQSLENVDEADSDNKVGTDGRHTKQDAVTNQNEPMFVDVSSSGDQSWNNKLIELVSSSLLPPECSPRQLARRGKLRRPLRRPNPAD